MNLNYTKSYWTQYGSWVFDNLYNWIVDNCLDSSEKKINRVVTTLDSASLQFRASICKNHWLFAELERAFDWT